jgi:hypothetical protein
MLKAGEVFEIAMLAHDTPPSMKTRPVAAGASYHEAGILQSQRCSGSLSGGVYRELGRFPSREKALEFLSADG